MTDLKDRILPTVQKPARYIGGEWGAVKKNKEDARAHAMEYLEKVGMAPYINARPRQISGGQK